MKHVGPIEIHPQLIQVHSNGVKRMQHVRKCGEYKLKMIEWTSMASQHIRSQSESSTSELTYFWPPKWHMGGRRFHNNEEVETATREWLPQEAYNSYRQNI